MIKTNGGPWAHPIILSSSRLPVEAYKFRLGSTKAAKITNAFSFALPLLLFSTVSLVRVCLDPVKQLGRRSVTTMAMKAQLEKMSERQNYRNLWHTDLMHSISADCPCKNLNISSIFCAFCVCLPRKRKGNLSILLLLLCFCFFSVRD